MFVCDSAIKLPTVMLAVAITANSICQSCATVSNPDKE